jgi:hypothetical protein
MPEAKTVQSYKASLVKFLSFLDGTKHPRDYEATDERLLKIQDTDVVRFLNWEAYHEEAPDVDARPTYCRGSNLLAHKRAISHFMPRQLMTWDPVNNMGNPTRSLKVLKAINDVKKFEVRRQGTPTQVRRPIEYDEFLNVLDIVRDPEEEEDDLKRCRLASVLTLQWHLIGRIDDMMKLKVDRVGANHNHPGTGSSKIEWSKNITEEREAAEQILLASHDAKLCCILSMGVYLEVLGRFDASHIKTEDPLFGDATNGHRAARNGLDSVFKNPKFRKRKPGNLGTHSNRKGPATYASRSGCSRDFVKRRGRWRAHKQVVDEYIDPSLPYPDAKTAATLCGPAGPCRYKVRDNATGVSRSYMLNVVAPTINQIYGEEMALLLAPALLWAAFDDSVAAKSVMPASLRKLIVDGFPGGCETNPVEKVSLLITGNGDQLRIVDLMTQDSTPNSDTTHTGGGVATGGGTAHGSGEEIQGLYSLLYQQQRQIEELKRDHNERTDGLLAEVRRMNTNIRRIARQPVIRKVGVEGIVNPSLIVLDRVPPSLSSRPTDLYVLWKEYEFGIGGRKAAKDFTYRERGANRAIFCRRKIFWDVVLRLISHGYTNETAIDHIYNHYGKQKSVTQILMCIRKEKSEISAGRSRNRNPLVTGQFI